MHGAKVKTVFLIKCHCELRPWGRYFFCGGHFARLYVCPLLWNLGDNLGNVTIQTVQCLSPVRTTSHQELSQCEVLGTVWVMLCRSWLCWLHGYIFCLSRVTQRSVTLSARPEMSRYCFPPDRIFNSWLLPSDYILLPVQGCAGPWVIFYLATHSSTAPNPTN
jgi:hypothetical protein